MGHTGRRLWLLAALFAIITCGGPAPGGGASASPTLPAPSPYPTGTAVVSPVPTASPTELVLPSPVPSATPASAEWLANLRRNAQSFLLRRPVPLVDMETGATVATVPAGRLDVGYETEVRGRAYWMTEYSVSRRLPNGILKSEVAAALGAPALPPSLAGVEWTRIPTNDRVVALTFDAGGDDAGLEAILAALEQTGVPATFFLTGRWAEKYPDGARAIASAYPIGNHTQSHPDLTALSDDAAALEITAGENAIETATGVDPHPLFRFPYGARDARTIAVANRLGYGAIRWTVDTLGWEGVSTGQSTGSVLKRVLDGLQPGEIVIMHVGAAPDGSTLDARALPQVIAEIRARGYAFASLADYLSR